MTRNSDRATRFAQDYAGPVARRFFHRRGRISRTIFWQSTLIAWTLFWIAFALLDGASSIDLTRVPSLCLLFSLFCLCSKRYHDLDRSSLRLLFMLIPVFGLVFVMWELGFRRGSVGENGYGADPRDLLKSRDYATV